MDLIFIIAAFLTGFAFAVSLFIIVKFKLRKSKIKSTRRFFHTEVHNVNENNDFRSLHSQKVILPSDTTNLKEKIKSLEAEINQLQELNDQISQSEKDMRAEPEILKCGKVDIEIEENTPVKVDFKDLTVFSNFANDLGEFYDMHLSQIETEKSLYMLKYITTNKAYFAPVINPANIVIFQNNMRLFLTPYCKGTNYLKNNFSDIKVSNSGIVIKRDEKWILENENSKAIIEFI